VCFHNGANYHWALKTWISLADAYTATQKSQMRVPVLQQTAYILPAKRHGRSNQTLTYTCSLSSCPGLENQNHL